ncbi:MAG: sulfate adenylyltransferase subunit 1, partial [Cyclobacteriaceae bacterium]
MKKTNPQDLSAKDQNLRPNPETKAKSQTPNAYLDMELLRFTTAGSVDDGKSTLIGRLLYDSKSIFQDQMDQLKLSSERKGLDHTDLAMLTDGL